MTLAQALAALHAAGRIRSPWLPGMHGTDVDGFGFRVLLAHPASGGANVLDDRAVVSVSGVLAAFMSAASHDTTDPATVGCLLTLLREAAGDTSIVIGRLRVGPDDVLVWAPFTFDARWETYCVLCVSQSGEVTTSGRVLHSHTEGEAVAVTLVALAATLQPQEPA